MQTRIGNMPVYEQRKTEVDAALYNLWRRARSRILLPVRFEWAEKPQIALIVDTDSWVVVDQNQYDLPLLAWLAFEDTGRSSIHTPVACTINFYHYMASRLRKPALQLLQTSLEQRLNKAAFYN